MLVLRRVNLSNSNSNIIVIVIFKTGLIVIVIIIIFFSKNNSNSNNNKISELLCISEWIEWGVWLVGMVKQIRAFKFGLGSGSKARRNQASNGVFFFY